jgi:hypothetical protein
MGTSYGNSFDPRSLSPALWLSDTGSDHAVWEDLSGNGRNFTQSTVANQPSIITNAVNGRQVRRFNGSSSFFYNTNAGINARGDFTIFAAHRYNSVAPSGNGWEGIVYTGLNGTQSTTASGQIHLQRENLTSRMGVHNSGVLPNGIFVDTIATGGILVPRVSMISRLGGTNGLNGTISVRTNGSSNTGTQSWTTNSTASSSVQIGGRQQTSVPYLNGDVYEVLIFPYALTLTQSLEVEKYLMKKWGIGFNPLSLGPALWLDASDSSTLYDATTGGSLVGAGGAVARWEDKSGNARHATQATLANRPLRTLGVQGGKDVLAFDGSDDFLATPAFGGTQDCTYFLVTASKNSTQIKVFAAHANSYDNPPLGANYVAVNEARLQTVQNGASGTTKLTAKLAASQNLQNNVFRIAEVELTSTNAGHIQRVNGTAHATTNPNSQDPGVFTKLTQSFGVGAYNTGYLPCNCDIAEIIYFTKLLTANDRREVQRYLAQKWNIIP